ncbi:MAG TPA: glycosyl hydrolase [Bacteroidales bacterium]|nr:glycosyl hydrolase [Bacteroidales bacterium]
MQGDTMERAYRIACSVLIISLFGWNVLTGQGVKYEAEAATLSGTITVRNNLTGYSGTGYVGQFENESDKVTFSVSIAQAGNFNIYIGYAAPYGEKINYININGNVAEVTFPGSAGFREVLYGKVRLNAGSNIISIIKSWGWFLVDYIRIEPNNNPEINVGIPYQLATPNPNIETRRLFAYLMDSFTKKIHSGAMSLSAIEEAQWLYANTGKYPALIGLDFMNHNRDWGWYDKSIVVNEAKNWYNQNGLVAICWHWRDPLGITDEFYTSNTSFDVSKISDPASAEYQAMVSDIDKIAVYLKQLQDAKVPVLFRPLHEASGGWFWWGAKGPEPCKTLWRLMFDRLVNYHGLKNLIWVWTTDIRADNMDWYPGDEYVDILGADIYAANGDFSSQVLTYNAIKEKFNGKKLITLSENGPVPDPDNLVADHAHWSWFMPWYGDFIRNPDNNPLSHWQKVMNHAYVVTLDEMPDLKNYPLVDNSMYPQGFFLDSWQPKSTVSPEYKDVQQATDPVTVAVTVDFHDTLAKVPEYLFGDNANLWTGTMSDNKPLMKHVADRNSGVIRGPGGSISDVFFWNRNVNQRPVDIPSTLVGSTTTDWPWYGDRPYSWENWTMAVDSFYSVLSQANATGMITVNYGYARYGTGDNPVANAAHMAADWVRYDNGRSKFWEIGNEVFGSWEAGYRIDPALNKDGQPEYITPVLYGQHCVVFIDSMRAAAKEIGVDIKIGVVMVEGSSTGATWNQNVAAQAGDKADFYSVHSYYTPYNQNSDVATILNSPSLTGNYKTYVWNEVAKAGKPKIPVALTEYNIFATGSSQPVSHANGMHAVLVTGEAMKTGYGAATRWDLANGWDNGNDHGMFSYNEPDIPNYTPHPAFFHLYYLQKFTGDVLLNSTITGATGVKVIPTAFHSGQIGAAIVNTAKTQKVVRLNLKNFRAGDRYYIYTLTGTAGIDFSRKVFVNGIGNTLVAGGPADYETIKAKSSLIGDEIRINMPPLSSVFILVEPGTKELAINNVVTSVERPLFNDNIGIYPNPAPGKFTVSNIPAGISDIDILDMQGRTVYRMKGNPDDHDMTFNINLLPGVYLINLSGNNNQVTKRLVIK